MSTRARIARLWSSIRGPLAIAALAAIATAGSFYAWGRYQRSRQAEAAIEDAEPGAAVAVERADSGEVVAEFTAPARRPLLLDPGDYHLRVMPDRRPSGMFPFRVAPGDWGTIQPPAAPVPLFELDEEPAMPFALVGLRGGARGADPVVIDYLGIRRIEGKSGKPLWHTRDFTRTTPETRLPSPETYRHFYEQAIVQPDRVTVPGHQWISPDMGSLGIMTAPRPVDLDGDGRADLVWSNLAGNTVSALSGEGDRWTWSRTAVDIPGAPADRAGVVRRPLAFQIPSGEPVVVVAFEPPLKVGPGGVAVGARPEPGWVQAFRGKSGEPAWTFAPPPDASDSGLLRTDAVTWDGREVVAVTSGRLIHLLDPKTGTPTGPPIGFDTPIVGMPEFRGPSVDGRREVVVRLQSDTIVARAWRGADELPGWRIPFGSIDPRGGWPRVVDLDGDGASEVILPEKDPTLRGLIRLRVVDGRTGRDRWRVPHHDRTGNARPGRLSRFFLLADMDVDGDGVRDLILPGRSADIGEDTTYLVALSGKDGAALWASPLPNTLDHDPFAWGQGPDNRPLIVAIVAGAAHNHRPMSVLLHPVSGRELGRVPGAYLQHRDDLDGDGQADLWGHSNRGLMAIRGGPMTAWRRAGFWSRGADYDRDGVADLIGADLDPRMNVHWLYNPYPPERDALPRSAVSGRDGRVLWTTALPRPRRRFVGGMAVPMPALAPVEGPRPDLDGDGVPDLVFGCNEGERSGQVSDLATLAIGAISGRDGSLLWREPRVDAGYAPGLIRNVEAAHSGDFDGDGVGDLALIVDERPTRPGPLGMLSGPAARRLVIVRGRDGVAFAGFVPPDREGHRTYQLRIERIDRPFDLDGDRIDDLLLRIEYLPSVPSADSSMAVGEIVAASGATGAPLARIVPGSSNAPAGYEALPDGTRATSLPCEVRDVDGDGAPEILTVEFRASAEDRALGVYRVLAHDPRKHIDLWMWDSPRSIAWDRASLVAIRRPGAAGHEVVVGIGGEAGSNWFWLDNRGRPHGRRPGDGSMYGFASDFDGDGLEEFLGFWDGQWRMGRDGFRETLWSSPRRQGRGLPFAFLNRSPDGSRAVLDDMGELFDLKTGRVLSESHDGPFGPVPLVPDDPTERLLLLPGYRVAGATPAALSAPRPPGDTASRSAAEVLFRPMEDDPRSWVAPPWADRVGWMPLTGPQVVQAAWIGLLATLPPGVLLWGLMRIRARGQRSGIVTLMLLVALAGLLMWEFNRVKDWVEYEDPIFSARVEAWGAGRTSLAVVGVGTPLVALGAGMVAGLVRRRWRRVLIWCGVAACCAVVAGFVLIRRFPPPPGGRYRIGMEWWNLVYAGAAAAGVVFLLWQGAMRLYQMIRHLRRRARVS